MTKPRVFVSSTFYDLRHIRNDLKKFIENYGFEPILNETGSIPFVHVQPLDESCFQEAQRSNMFILIIGGRYGSAISTQQDKDGQQRQLFYEKYISITRQEYRSAHDRKIPIYIFVDRSVYAEYATFLKNQENQEVHYAHVDSVEVFKFIAEASGKFSNNSIQVFDRFDDISEWLREQWAGLFFNFLVSERERDNRSTLLDAVKRIETLSESITQMTNRMGERIITNGGEYNQLIAEQKEKTLAFHANRLVASLKFPDLSSDTLIEDAAERVASALANYLFSDEVEQYLLLGPSQPRNEALQNKMKAFEGELSSIHSELKKFSLSKSAGTDFAREALPLVRESGQLRTYFKQRLKEEVRLKFAFIYF